MPYSPYGKGGGGANLMDVVPYRVGVPRSRQSGLEKFEGLVTAKELIADVVSPAD